MSEVIIIDKWLLEILLSFQNECLRDVSRQLSDHEKELCQLLPMERLLLSGLIYYNDRVFAETDVICYSDDDVMSRAKLAQRGALPLRLLQLFWALVRQNHKELVNGVELDLRSGGIVVEMVRDATGPAFKLKDKLVPFKRCQR